MRYLLAGESHGPALVGIVEGLPAGLAVPAAAVDEELTRRREGHGRGLRARRIERDRVRFLAGLADGVTLGSPVAFVVENRDATAARGRPAQRWTVPRPGHADLAGLLKYGYDDCAPVAERASARSTVGLTVVGALAKLLLARFGVEVLGHVLAVGRVMASPGEATAARLRRIRSGTPLRCLDKRAEAEMAAAVDAAAAAGTTLGGVFEVVAFGLPAGLGSYVHPDRRLDALLAADLMAIPSVKAVEVGEGIAVAGLPGHLAHDEVWRAGSLAAAARVEALGAATRGAVAAQAAVARAVARAAARAAARAPLAVERPTNRAGGLEGGVTNGMPLVVRGYAKPISTLARGLPSVDLSTGRAARAPWVRSDACVVPAAGVVGEAVVAWRLACALVEKLGGDALAEMLPRWAELRRQQAATGRPRGRGAKAAVGAARQRGGRARAAARGARPRAAAAAKAKKGRTRR